MSFLETALLGVGLAMDAFAVSISKGLCMRKNDMKYTFMIALFFGGFQALMPLIGWLLGSSIMKYVESVDHWIAFVLLLIIGIKAIYEALHEEEETCETYTDGKKIDYRELVVLAIATSIDALAVGISFALVPNVSIVSAIVTIGIVTFAISFAGVIIGRLFGSRVKKGAEVFGGIVLIAIGTRILLQGIGVIG